MDTCAVAERNRRNRADSVTIEGATGLAPVTVNPARIGSTSISRASAKAPFLTDWEEHSDA